MPNYVYVDNSAQPDNTHHATLPDDRAAIKWAKNLQKHSKCTVWFLNEDLDGPEFRPVAIQLDLHP